MLLVQMMGQIEHIGKAQDKLDTSILAGSTDANHVKHNIYEIPEKSWVPNTTKQIHEHIDDPDKSLISLHKRGPLNGRPQKKKLKED